MSIYVTRPGFEPRQAEPESAVLPLYYRAIRSANVGKLFFLRKSPGPEIKNIPLKYVTLIWYNELILKQKRLLLIEQPFKNMPGNSACAPGGN